MLIAILVILTAVLWFGIVVVYFRRELGEWIDNRFGPDHKDPKTPKTKPFWRFYG